jgi:carbon storage regulator
MEVAMLVLSRSKSEAVIIGEVSVEVVEIRGDKVRLGISAPPEVPVHRSEVYDAVGREPSTPTTQPQAHSPETNPKRQASSGGSEPLILSRKKNESIVIGNDITVIVVEIRQVAEVWKVRLGIQAPKEVPVHRKEVWEGIMRFNSPSEESKPS